MVIPTSVEGCPTCQTTGGIYSCPAHSPNIHVRQPNPYDNGVTRQTVNHIQENTRYRVVIERAASTKGVLGYKVEANGDDKLTVFEDANALRMAVEKATTAEAPEAVKEP